MQQTKKIFIEIPTWLGDAVMSTPAIENLIKEYPDCELIIFGSVISTNLFNNHPNVKKIVVDNSKSGGNRYLNLYNLAKSIEKVDIALSFRRNITTKFLLFFIKANKKFHYKRYTKKQRHQVLRYNDFINKSLFLDTEPNSLKIYLQNSDNIKEKPILGLNPGATYGSAKRWYPKEFAKVALELATRYDIVIFGGPDETDIANDIESILKKSEVKNYKNLAGKTSIEELIEQISKLDLFITNDSGPMHLAAAFEVPTVCIFGPTKYKETHQWKNPNEMIVKKDFKCMPCMKRECPLEDKENHQCMKSITATNVLDKIYAQIIAPTLKKKKLQKDFLEKYNLDKGTKLILFKANNFKQNGVVSFFHIISRLNSTNFQAVVSGDDASLAYAKKELRQLDISNNILFLNDVPIKVCDIFVLPTKNKKFANNVLKAMKAKCAVFAPKTNEVSSIIDIFATMQGVNDPNTAHKIDALLSDNKNLKLIQKENKEKTKYINKY
jgi:heptosyltransferase-2